MESRPSSPPTREDAPELDREALLRQWREAEDTKVLDRETSEGAS